MTQLHEPQISKTRKITGYILSLLPSGMLLMTGVMKIYETEEMKINMGKIPNIGDLVFYIGVIELLCLVLYWIPKTCNLGFFLLCSYSGGIIIAEIVSGQLPIMGIVISMMLYIGTFLRKPSLLKNNQG